MGIRATGRANGWEKILSAGPCGTDEPRDVPINTSLKPSREPPAFHGIKVYQQWPVVADQHVPRLEVAVGVAGCMQFRHDLHDLCRDLTLAAILHRGIRQKLIKA